MIETVSVIAILLLIGAGILLASRRLRAQESLEIPVEASKSEPAAPPPPAGFRTVLANVKNRARNEGIDPCVAAAIVWHESRANPQAVNPSDPSFGLFQILDGNVFSWLRVYNTNHNTNLTRDDLLNADTNITVGLWVIKYFQGRGFRFPEHADIYNVGERNWTLGRRNIAYRRAVEGFYIQCREGAL